MEIIKLLNNYKTEYIVKFNIGEYFKDENNQNNYRYTSYFNFSEYENLVCFDMNNNILVFDGKNLIHQYFDDKVVDCSNIINKCLFCFSTNCLVIRDFNKNLTIREIQKENSMFNEEIISLMNYNEFVLFSGYKNGNFVFYDLRKKDAKINLFNLNNLHNLNDVKLNDNYLSCSSKSHSFWLYDIRNLKSPLVNLNNSQGIFHQYNQNNRSEVFIYDNYNDIYSLKKLNILNLEQNLIINNFSEIRNIRNFREGIWILGTQGDMYNKLELYDCNTFKTIKTDFPELEDLDMIKNFYTKNDNKVFLVNELEVMIYLS